jgi:dipeptidyl aminopeptidase/acylaminoacyl peptidase
MQPGSRQVIATLPGGGWFGGEVSPDNRRLALTRCLSAEESQVWVIDLASGERRQVLPAPGEATRAAHYVGAFAPDGRSLWFASNRSGEFVEGMQVDLASGAIRRLTSHIPWDTAGMSATEDGRLVAVRVNVDGRHELHLFDGASGAERALPPLPAGSVTRLQFHRGRGELAFGVNSAQGPNQLFALDPATGRVEQWTRAEAAPGVDMGSFRGQQVIRWTSFDGRVISGLMNLPPARFAGPRPVLIDIHGGPESQAQAGFMGRYNYFIEEMGLAVIQPNVRGSSGFGKTFLALDNGTRREDAVRDIGALLDWIATQSGLDASRVVVSGGSYGGCMSLAVAVHHGDRIAGAIDDVGISHFVTFLTHAESYRRDLRRAEYGDERDPAMREFLDRISPLTQAHRIRKPLFVIQGRNDPRVPYTEAEQVVERARADGTTVWYLRAENEGHGFARKENADFRFYAMVRFLETVLQLPAPPTRPTGARP